MCTVSVLVNDAMVLVTMNRDERRHRLEGAMFQSDTACYPTDQQAAGTWCGINTHGIIFCLLNRYDAPISADANIISRGDIIPRALQHTSVESASSFVSRLNHEQYNGFRLLVLSAAGGVWHDWDRCEHHVSAIEDLNEVFASSSSLQSTLIPGKREVRYRRWQRAQTSAQSPPHRPACPGKIPDIHLLDTSVAPNESIFMVRRDTHTKSICQLAVTRTDVSLDYWPAQTGWKQNLRERWTVPLQGVDGPAVKSAKYQ